MLEQLVDPENQETFIKEQWAKISEYASPAEVDACPPEVKEAFDGMKAARVHLDQPTVTSNVGGLEIVAPSLGTHRRLVLASSGGNPVRIDSGPQPKMLAIAAPDYLTDTCRIAMEVIGYSRQGDFNYAHATEDVHSPAHGMGPAEPYARFMAAIAKTPDEATVLTEPSAWQALFSSERRKLEKQIATLLQATPALTAIAEALVSDVGLRNLPWQIEAAVEHATAGPANSARLRSPLGVLKSGEAGPKERAVTIAAVLNAAGLPAGVAEDRNRGTVFAIVQLNQQWLSLRPTNNATVRALVPTSLPSHLATLGNEPTPQKRQAKPAMTWLTEFVQQRA